MRASATIFVFLKLLTMTISCFSYDMRWDHSVDLDENFRVLWKVKEPDIIIELQVKTLGYVGFGFARSEHIYGADMVIGWVDENPFFQDRHIPVHSQSGEPILDPSQDYILLLGHQNDTHTVIRFWRKLDTCDEKNDVAITNDTMKIIYMYHEDEPKRELLEHGRLPEPEVAQKPIKSLLILQRSTLDRVTKNHDETIESFDVQVEKKSMSNVTKACSIIRPMLNKLVHITAFKPTFEPLMARNYIIHMTVYECKQQIKDVISDPCLKQHELKCSSIVATWSKGSEGFVYPDDVGYPVDAEATFFLIVHYDPFNSWIADGSGIKFYTTATRRKHDAGILSIGIQPVWTHVIPPGFRKVTSIGYCTGKCNKEAFAPDGINVVAIQMQTHEMGTSVKVGLVRNGAELNPIAHDQNIDSEFLEYRQLREPVQIFPGDDLMVECAYNSYEKTKLTLGGYEPQQEICQAMLIYYPRQENLSSCQSKPKTRNFLKSLNIEKLQNTPPFSIELPEKYAGKTLEEHLKTYDWRTEFDHFERVSKTFSIDVICSGTEDKMIEVDPVAIKQPFKPPFSHCNYYSKEYEFEELFDDNILSPAVQQARSKITLRSSELGTLDFQNSVLRLKNNRWLLLAILVSLGSKIIICSRML